MDDASLRLLIGPISAFYQSPSVAPDKLETGFPPELKSSPGCLPPAAIVCREFDELGADCELPRWVSWRWIWVRSNVKVRHGGLTSPCAKTGSLGATHFPQLKTMPCPTCGVTTK
jgi:hypothetical protein